MSLFSSFDRTKHFSELGDPLSTQGSGFLSAAQRRVLALTNLFGDTGYSLVAATAAANINGAYFTVTTNVALGNYANAINGKLDFSTSGRVTGLGGVICAELDLSASCTQGSYACFEGELNCPSGGKTGTRTSFLSLNAWGADVATFNANGFLFDLGTTIASGGIVEASTKTGIAKTHTIRVNVNGTTLYLAANTSINFGGS